MRSRILAALALLAALAAGGAFWWIHQPYGSFPASVYVDLPKGTSTRGMARILANAGVIQSPIQFLAVRAMRPGKRLLAGEYRFDHPASATEVFDRIARGDVFFYVLPVPEGYSTFDIAATLERLEVMPGREFLKAAHDPAAIRDLDPKAPSLEGYLFPDTYHLTRHTTAAQLCHMMTDRFRKAWAEAGARGASVHDTITLASLVEREARLPQERPLVASVFANRLKIGMALQCDPTTIYAAQLQERYRGAIFRSDLMSQNLYNTYQHPGLPPGPIANPGVDSIRAALQPAATRYLYFVARPDGSGAHQFSAELAQHTRAVQKYRRGQSQQAQRDSGVPGAKAARTRRGR